MLCIIKFYILGAMDINNLLKKAKNGDNSAENLLFKNLTARFMFISRHKIANKEDCEEVVQNALTAIAENYKQTNFEISIAVWVKKILDNKIIDYYRSKKSGLSKMSRVSNYAITATDDIIDPGFKQRLLDCLKKINAHNKQHSRILVLKYLGYSVNEIQEKLNLTKNNFYSVLSRARSMLENCLEKEKIK